MELKRKEVILMGSKKIGRPIVGKLKNVDIKVRIDEETHKKLLEYCKEKGITKAKVIRELIENLVK